MATLTEAQLQSLQKQLDEREAELREQVRVAKASLTERPAAEARHVQDPGEDAEERFRQGLEHVDLQRDLEELREIENARERIADGSYGECVDCGLPIPVERLKAQPIAMRCIACQTKFEQTRQTTPRFVV